MKEAYTSKELAEILDLTPMSVHRRAKREGWESRKRRARGGGKEFLVASMPSDVRAAITVSENKQSDVPALSDSNAIIPDWSNQIGLDRYQIVTEYRTYLQKKKGKKGELTDAFLSAYNAGVLLPEVFERIGTIAKPTLYRWQKQLADNGDDYTCLCDGRGKWKQGGPKGLGQLGLEAEQVILNCYLQPNKPSMALAYRAMAVTLEKRGLPVPSYASVRRFLQRFDANHHDLVVLRREGEKALKDKVGPYIARNDKILAVGDVIFSDGHDLNFMTIHPVTGRPARMTLICWFDWRSRIPVGFEIMPTENTVAISSALRMAIVNLGQVPRVAYIDNGKAFKGKYFTQTGSEIEALDGLYARLGISVQFSRPYEARTKIVERFFRTFNEQCARLMPSYCGANISDKPAWRMRNEKYHQQRHSDYVPTIQETAEIFRLFIQWYAQQTHRGLNGQTPAEIFEAGRGQGVCLEELNRHFLFSKKFRPDRCGFVIDGIRFESDCLYGLNKTLVAKYSWSNLSEVYIYDTQGREIGVAKPVEAIHPLARHFGDELDLLKVKEANKRQRQLKQSTLSLVRELDRPESSGLNELPWMQSERQPLQIVRKPQAIEAAPEPEMSADDRRKLEAVQAAAVERIGSRPSYEVPEYFSSRLDRYSCLFDIEVVQGIELSPEDSAFCRTYEKSTEYEEATGARFERLREIYTQPATAAK